jgi:sigma-E factor negative regulatory protein RseC
MYGSTITHEGIIEQVTDEELSVRLTRLPACGECHAKSMCSVPGAENNELLVPGMYREFNHGDRVTVSIERAHGFRAVFLGYVLPFLLVVTTLSVLTFLHMKEWIAGLISLGILAPYYTMITILKKRIEDSLTFRVFKSSQDPK